MAILPQSAFPLLPTEFEEFLGQVAEAARALSGATGSAIAIRHGNDRDGEEVLCVARSGDSAPPLQSRLEANSGISGECLVSGSVLHCDDTAGDHRVDAEVCRQLGVRSIVVLPLQGRGRTAGVLEVFSTKPHAFTGEHIDSLKGLAEIIEMAYDSRPGDGPSDVTDQGPHINPATVAVPQATQQAQQSIWSHIQLPFPLSFLNGRRDYWIAGGGLAMLLLVTLISLKALHAPVNTESPGKAIPAAVKPSPPEWAEISLQRPGDNVDRQSDRALHKANSANPNDERHGLLRAARVEVLTGAGNVAPPDSGSPSSASAPENPPQIPTADLDSTQAPALPLATNSITPDALLEPALAMPKLAPATSQAVSGGILDHRVNPIYPPQAIAMKLEGEVVLAATITKKGRVRDLKLLKGSPILGQAAMDAVKQWRYLPYRLNGHTLESQTEITVQFHVP